MSGFDISKLKSISASTLSTIAAKESRPSYTDERFWKPTPDPKTGESNAVIRFLPSIREGELPWVEKWSYFIKGPNGYYIETSLRTIHKPDPMAEYIAQCWREAASEAEKGALRSKGLTRARHQYIANILVLNDPAHPENNGKVFLYSFGQKIFEMITDKAKAPVFPGDIGNINVTDWDRGANFRLRVFMKDKFPCYDKSYFDSCSSIGSDEDIIRWADQMYDLGEFVDPANCKSYDELKDRVNRVFGLTQPEQNGSDDTSFETGYNPATVANAAANQYNPVAQQAQSAFVAPQSAVKPVVAASATPKESTPWDSDDIDFDSLMKEL